MKDKNIEYLIKFPRVRMSDGKRLAFLGGVPGMWVGMRDVPEIYPVNPLPPLSRKTYTFENNHINVLGLETIPDLIEKILQCGDYSPMMFLHTIILRKTGELEIDYENITPN